MVTDEGRVKGVRRRDDPDEVGEEKVARRGVIVGEELEECHVQVAAGRSCKSES